jgi:hypothetical protein
MYPSNESRLVLGKLLIAALGLVALIAPLAKELAPGVAWGFLVFYCLAGLVGLLAVLVVASVCSLQFSQFILRLGGTDTQWFWFSGEPRGLAALRKGQRVDEHAQVDGK